MSDEIKQAFDCNTYTVNTLSSEHVQPEWRYPEIAI
jgi:hypothetical protein